MAIFGTYGVRRGGRVRDEILAKIYAVPEIATSSRANLHF